MKTYIAATVLVLFTSNALAGNLGVTLEVCDNSKFGNTLKGAAERSLQISANETILTEKSFAAESGTLHVSVRYWSDVCSTVMTRKGIPEELDLKNKGRHAKVYTLIGFMPKSGQRIDSFITTDVGYKIDPKQLVQLSGHSLRIEKDNKFFITKNVPTSGIASLSLVGILDLDRNLLFDNLRSTEGGQINFEVASQPTADQLALNKFLGFHAKGPISEDEILNKVFIRDSQKERPSDHDVSMKYIKNDVRSALTGVVIRTSVPGLEQVSITL
jgi:hypothetical protein